MQEKDLFCARLNGNLFMQLFMLSDTRALLPNNGENSAAAYIGNSIKNQESSKEPSKVEVWHKRL